MHSRINCQRQHIPWFITCLIRCKCSWVVLLRSKIDGNAETTLPSHGILSVTVKKLHFSVHVEYIWAGPPLKIYTLYRVGQPRFWLWIFRSLFSHIARGFLLTRPCPAKWRKNVTSVLLKKTKNVLLRIYFWPYVCLFLTVRYIDQSQADLSTSERSMEWNLWKGNF